MGICFGMCLMLHKTEIKNFLPNPDKIRQEALTCKFSDMHAYDGEVYKRVVVKDIPGLTEAVEKIMGPVLMLGMGYRLNYNGELPNHARHIDVDWGTHALVLYLSDGHLEDTGTAFWSSLDEDAEMVGLCHEEFGKAVIYRSDQPHSRWPLEAYGDSPETGRLIAVAFFTPFSEM